MIHLQNAASAGGAMMCAIGFSSFTLLAKPGLACGLDGKGWSISVHRGFMGRKVGVASFAVETDRRSWIGEDGSSV